MRCFVYISVYLAYFQKNKELMNDIITNCKLKNGKSTYMHCCFLLVVAFCFCFCFCCYRYRCHLYGHGFLHNFSLSAETNDMFICTLPHSLPSSHVWVYVDNIDHKIKVKHMLKPRKIAALSTGRRWTRKKNRWKWRWGIRRMTRTRRTRMWNIQKRFIRKMLRQMNAVIV